MTAPLPQIGLPEEIKRGDPEVFEVGLVLAGAVSGGAYAAGALDFLLQALDAWEAQKAKDRANGQRTVPDHRIRLRVASGASAGSINGALLAIALRYAFTPIKADNLADGALNPFYDTWVQQIDISRLLETKDLKDSTGKAAGSLSSLLDSSCLDDIGDHALNFRGPPCPRPRPYVDDPLKLSFTVTNLRGVPYSIAFQGAGVQAGLAQKYGMAAHSDYLKFAYSLSGQPDRTKCYPDERELSGRNSSADPHWRALMQAVLASAAFPAGLRYRDIVRQASDYWQRTVIVPDEHGRPQSARLIPDDTMASAGDYRFVAVDGGCMDNEPLDLARTELAGRLGRNPRAGAKAYRALVMIDPFPEPEELGAESSQGLDLLKALLSLTSAWKQQARFKPEDIGLADAADVYSRFVVSPVRREAGGEVRYGANAIAAGKLQGFSGFFSQDFRIHDYLLGRQNCQQFLARHFVVPVGNTVVARWTQDPVLQSYLIRDGAEVMAPLIPLMDGLQPDAHPEKLRDWPRGAVDLPKLCDALEARLDAVYALVADSFKVKFLTWAAWKFWARDKLMKLVKGALAKGLDDLLSTEQRAWLAKDG